MNRCARRALSDEATKDAAQARPNGGGISVVVPVYNERDSIDGFLERLQPVLEDIRMPFEIVFVDDGSRDATWSRIQERRASCGRIRSIRLSRNFGKEIALAAGLDAACGEAVVFIDVDLQDPPELITEFVRLWRAGYQNVYGLRVDRRSDSWAKRLTASWFYRLFNWLSDTAIPFNAGDFRLIGADVVDAVRACRDRRRFMKGLYAWVGFPSVGVPYERRPRAAGRSKFGAAKLLALAIDGVVSHSTALLRVWTWVGLVCAGAATVLGMVLLGQYFLSGRNPPSGFYLTILVILGVSSLQFVTLGIMGEYLGRIYGEVKDRPLYLLRDDDASGQPFATLGNADGRRETAHRPGD
ncbi:MAG: glycosyltransferase family 2 protein [Gammaproteobacteria bacterium]|nr:glycosyltransferase family 2 protein [Gammaproteobacteria bacterium]MDE0440521.1 glycosyltransferase family 2 protein [Gammaproteobacteria bacterium]